MIVARASRRAAIETALGAAVDPRLTFGAWVATQPAAVQDSVLGPRRAARFRAGTLVVDRYTDPPLPGLTLEQLAATLGLDLGEIIATDPETQNPGENDR